MVIEKDNVTNSFSTANPFGCSILEINMQREVWKERHAERFSFDRGIFNESTTVWFQI